MMMLASYIKKFSRARSSSIRNIIRHPGKITTTNYMDFTTFDFYQNPRGLAQAQVN